MSDNSVIKRYEGSVKAPVVSSPIEAYQMLLSRGGSLENIEKMMELQARWEQIEAKKAYVHAMAEFKADPPKIVKDKTVGYNKTSYNHASLGNITSTINASLAKHGLSAAWATEQSQHGIKVTCTITHNFGHSESTSLTAGADNSGAKNSIQAIGSTITYLQRYTLLALTGLATHDDDDGHGACVQYVTEEQRSKIVDMINSTGTDDGKFLEWLNVESVEQIPCNLFNKAMAALKSKVKS